MLRRVLLLAVAARALGAATNTTITAKQPWKLRNGTQPWKLRNAKRNATNAMPWKKRTNMSHWKGIKVALLYRGMHYGSYKSERHGGKFVRVNANHASVIENHLAKIRRPLEKAGATISTVLACTHQSDVVQDWLKNVEATNSEVIETQLRKDKKNKVRPNELLQRAYALAATQEWDVLISLRADLFLKRDLADLTRPPVTERLWLPFREVFLNIHHTPCAFHERPPNERCLYAWTKHGSRFSDALRIIPYAAVSFFWRGDGVITRPRHCRGDGVEESASIRRVTETPTVGRHRADKTNAQAAHAPRHQSCRRRARPAPGLGPARFGVSIKKPAGD